MTFDSASAILAQAGSPPSDVVSHMNAGGWIFMIGSISFVLVLTYYCFRRVLTKPAAADHMHAPIEIDTHDQNT